MFWGTEDQYLSVWETKDRESKLYLFRQKQQYIINFLLSFVKNLVSPETKVVTGDYPATQLPFLSL